MTQQSGRAAIAPSILSADFANLEAALRQVESADLVHVDVMDNHFVPNLTIGQPVVKRLAEVSSLPLDVHLMIENPDRLAPEYVFPNVSCVMFHIEAAQAPVRLARDLHERGVRAGVALRPATPLESIEDLLGELDRVLILSVEPGFGGQSFIERSIERIERLRHMVDERGLSVDIEVDGGVTPANAAAIVAAGATTLVAGSAVFTAPDPAQAIAALRQSA